MLEQLHFDCKQQQKLIEFAFDEKQQRQENNFKILLSNKFAKLEKKVRDDEFLKKYQKENLILD